MSKNTSQGHRERLRGRIIKNGFEGFHEYEVLEFLLTFIFRRGDVKPLAKELIKCFGCFSKVLDATVQELENVKGMGKTSALNLVAFRHAMAFYYRNLFQTDKEAITKMTTLIEMLRAQIGHQHNEVIFSIFLNAKNEVLSLKALGEGTVTQAAAFPRRIVEEALKYKATSIILAHNHPNGIAAPSEQDISITAEIQRALGLIEVSMQDHIILADNAYYSFHRNNLI